MEETQRLAINEALKRAFNSMKKLQRDNAVVTKETETELHIKIKPFPEEGAELKEKLHQDILKVVGGKEGDWLWDTMAKRLEKSLRKFGTVERELIGRVRENYNEVTEDGVTRGFPFSVSFDSMQQNLFKFDKDAVQE